MSLLDRLYWGPSACWAWACLAILSSGALTRLAPGSAWSVTLGYALGTLYPALLLAGALGYAGRRSPVWLPLAALAVGAGRGAAQLVGLPGLAHGVALAVEPGLVLAAAALVLREPTAAAPSPSQRLLTPALLCIAALEAASALAMLHGAPLPDALGMAWVAGGGLLLAVQLAAWGVVGRRELQRAHELLERRVAEQTERYRVVSELTSDLAFACRIGPGLDVTYEWVTSAQGRVTGYTPGEIDGLGWLGLVPEEERGRVHDQVAAMLRGELDEAQMRIITRSGEERFLQVRVEARPHPEKGFTRLVGAACDVTERVRTEQERQRLDQRLRETQHLESLGRLAGGIAHDFNNALMVILGNVKLALGEVEPDGRAEQHLRRIGSAADFASELTEQILAYSGRAAVALEALDLSALVQGTLELLHASLRGKASLETHLPPGLPGVEGDATQIRQVLVNLVTNASQALGEEGGVIRVRTGTRGLAEHEIAEAWGSSDAQPDHYVLLEVSDTGPGLDASMQAFIFEPFFTTRASGRGLGLSAVLGIVRAHGGLIRVHSQDGNGTSFQVLLPRSSRAARPAPRGAASPAMGQGRILVIDDDDAVLEVAASFLDRAGFAVLSASGGRAALDLLADAEIRVDAALLDLVMPDLPTEEALAALRELRPGLPVVLTSGFDREQVARRFALDGHDFLRKPYSPEELVAAVRGALGQS
jgi:two-component system cell cycle sensor histidine kinase/response regulator CckA